MDDDNVTNRLKILPKAKADSGIISIGNTGVNLEYGYKFIIHIPTLSEDIMESMKKYLDSLKRDHDLIDKFRTAIYEIYAVKRVVI